MINVATNETRKSELFRRQRRGRLDETNGHFSPSPLIVQSTEYLFIY